MRAFITGMTGFAGSHLAEHLVEHGDQVLGCGRTGRWNFPTTAGRYRAAELIRWDVTVAPSAETRQQIAAFRPDCIFHLAAISVPADCGPDQPTDEALRTNVGGTQAVIQLAESLACRPRILLVSSCYVYAPVGTAQPRVREDAVLGPTSGYGRSKLAAEQVLRRALDTTPLDAVVARVFQHTGPRQPARMIVPELARQFVRGDNPVRVANLDTYLDLADVRDIVRAYRILVESGARHETYNVGSGICVRSGEVVESLRQLHDPARPITESSPGKRQHPIAELSKISQLGWQPTIPLETTLADTLSYWQEVEAG